MGDGDYELPEVNSAEDFEMSEEHKSVLRNYNFDASLKNYVRLRRKHPNVELDITNTGGLDFGFFRQQELEAHHIEPILVVHCLDADLAAHSQLSLLLMEKILERKGLQKAGNTHIVSRKLAISDLLVNNLIGVMLDSLHWNGELEICADLTVLIKHQLGLEGSQYRQEQRQKEYRNTAISIILRFIQNKQNPTLRKVANLMNVDATTVMRWLGEGDWLEEANNRLLDLEWLRKKRSPKMENK